MEEAKDELAVINEEEDRNVRYAAHVNFLTDFQLREPPTPEPSITDPYDLLCVTDRLELLQKDMLEIRPSLIDRLNEASTFISYLS